jgi:hypothetical protein
MFVTPLKLAAVKIAYISYFYNFFHSNFSFNFASSQPTLTYFSKTAKNLKFHLQKQEK